MSLRREIKGDYTEKKEEEGGERREGLKRKEKHELGGV